MTNREYMINMLLDGLEKELERINIDDCGASEEAMINYHIACPYFGGDERSHCKDSGVFGREMCVRCKWEWLDNDVDE